MKTAAVILAAGFSRRMGRDKALLPFGGVTALERIVAAHRAAGTGQMVVVAGANAGALERLGLSVDLIKNPQPETGMYESLRLGTAALGQDAAWFFVHPVDVPLVSAQTLRRLADAAAGSDADALAPVFQGRRGHPPLLSRRLRQVVLDDPGTGGLRAVLARRAVSGVAVDDRAVILEMNSPEQYVQAMTMENGERRMELAISHRNGIGVISLQGRLDSGAAPLFDEWFARQDNPGTAGYVMDMQEVAYITSAGLRSILKLLKTLEARGGGLAFCGMSSPVHDLFRIAGFTSFMKIYANQEEALSALTA